MCFSVLARPEEQREAGLRSDDDEIPVECAHYIISLYGVRRFLADIDANREYWRDGGGIVGATLDWASTDGFGECLGKHSGLRSHDILAYRQRHLINAARGRGF
jgi:hypothetical protein